MLDRETALPIAAIIALAARAKALGARIAAAGRQPLVGWRAVPLPDRCDAH